MVYKSIIAKVASSSSSSLSSRLSSSQLIMRYIYQDIPFHTGQRPPPMDVYHVAMASLGKCRQIDPIMDILNDMESNKIIRIQRDGAARAGVGEAAEAEGGSKVPNATSNTSRSESETTTAYAHTNTSAHNDAYGRSDKSTEITYNFPNPDRMAYLTALTGSSKCKASHCSIEIMSRMTARGIQPDKVVYNQVLQALSNTNTQLNERYQLTKQIWKEMEDMQQTTGKIMLSENTCRTLISIFSKENQWEDVALVRTRMNMHKGKVNGEDITKDKNDDEGGKTSDGDEKRAIRIASFTLGYHKDLEKLQKVGHVNKPWYKLGRVTIKQSGLENDEDGFVVEFGIQTHRNPIENGLSLVFYDGSTRKKLGFMLIRNEIENQIQISQEEGQTINEPYQQRQPQSLIFSSIMGMFIDEDQRGKGLASIIMGIWIQICLNSNVFPRSEKINKPLLSLVLSNFGFVPISEGGIEVEISPIAHVEDNTSKSLSWVPEFALYSKSLSPMDGSFGEREMRIQRMIVTRFPPNPRGRVTAVKTEFEHPMTQKARNGLNFQKDKAELGTLVEKVGWKDKGSIQFDVDDNLLCRTVFGYLYA